MQQLSQLILGIFVLSLIACQSSSPQTEEKPAQTNNISGETGQSLQPETAQETAKEYWKDLHQAGQWFEGTLKDIPIWLYLDRVNLNSDGSYSYGIYYGYNSSQGASIYLTGEGKPNNIEVDFQHFEAGELVDGERMQLELKGELLTGEWRSVKGKRFPIKLKAVGHEKYSQAIDLIANLANLRLPIVNEDYYEGLNIPENIKPHYNNKNFGKRVPNFKSLLGAQGNILAKEAAVVWGKLVQPQGETLLLYTATEVKPENCRSIVGTYQEDPKNMLAAALFDKKGNCLWNSSIGNDAIYGDTYFMDFGFSIQKVNRISAKWTTYMRGERGARMVEEEVKHLFNVSPQGLN